MKNKKVACVLFMLGMTMILIGLTMLILEIKKENYCNNLQPREYFENAKCIEKIK